ncbi:MAG: hypothetical protein DRP74_09190 [Candidatus Omnitrophota bacterium]|nr:MAG: hypothetical protein DRP74_09190 [Candidatus Omnitrophota bacterium]
MESSERQDKLAVILIAVFCFSLYLNSLWNIFAFDDRHMITHNLYIKNIKFLPLFFKGYITSYPMPKGMFRPLLMATFSFNYFFSGLNPLGYHITNIVFHFLNAVLLYILLKDFKPDLPFGLLLSVVLLFCAHPLNTEAVTYISSRSDLMVTMWISLGFLIYLKRKYLLSLLLYLAALLTKETAIIFPALIVSYDFIFFKLKVRSSKTDNRTLSSKVIFYICLVGLTLLYLFYRELIFGYLAESAPIRSLYSNILTQSAVTLFYLRLFLWPDPLTLHHVFPVFDSLFRPFAAVSIAVLLMVAMLIFILRKRHPLISMGLAWYLICLLPKFYARLNFVATEHHFYLPSFGIYLILASSCAFIYVKFRRKFIIAATGLICVFSVLVWVRNYEWKDGLTLWKAAIRRDSRSATAYNNLGIEYMRLGMNKEAEKSFRKAISLSNSISTQVNPRGNLAALYIREKKFKEATALLNEAFKIKPNYHSLYQILGALYIGVGEGDKAEGVWKEGLRLYPQSSTIQINLGIIYLKRGELEEAKEYFRAAIDSDPESYIAYCYLGQVFEEEGKIDLAIEAYEQSVRINPDYVTAHYNLGTLYAKKGDRRAFRELKEAIRLKPDFAEAYNNLAVLYASMHPPQLELARKHIQRAQALGYEVKEGFLRYIEAENE